jgi:hypothetical protein
VAELGSALSSEEHAPQELVANARRAEEAGFEFAMISDHFHPALEIWPNAALGGNLSYELPLPLHFEQASENVAEDDIGEAIPCGPDVDRYVEHFREYEQAGYTHIYFHQIGRDQEGFFRFFEQELQPKL